MIRCPFCHAQVEPGSKHCVGLIGAKGGSARSERKTAAAQANARKPRPRKIDNDAQIAKDAVEVAEQLTKE